MCIDGLKVKKIVNKVWLYIKPGLEGDDGLFSMRRNLGTICTIIALGLSIHAELGACDCIANRILVSGMVFSAGLAFWSITSVATYFNNKLTSNESVSKEVISKDGESSELKINQTQ